MDLHCQARILPRDSDMFVVTNGIGGLDTRPPHGRRHLGSTNSKTVQEMPAALGKGLALKTQASGADHRIP